MPHEIAIRDDRIKQAEATIGQARQWFAAAQDAYAFLLREKVWVDRQMTKEAYFESLGTNYNAAVRTAKALTGLIEPPEEKREAQPVISLTHQEILVKAEEAEEQEPDHVPVSPKSKKEKPAGPVDGAGRPVPEFMLDVFENRIKWLDLYAQARDLGRAIGSLARLVGGEEICSCQSLINARYDKDGNPTQVSCHAMNAVAHDLEARAPYAVCPACNGTSVVTVGRLCETCGEKGYLTMDQWMTARNG